MKKLIIIVLLMSIVISGCSNQSQLLEGKGGIKKVEYDLRDFTKLDISKDFIVSVSLGEEYSIVVETNEELFEYFVLEVNRDTLYANYKENVNIKNSNIKMYITMKSLNGLNLNNDVKLTLLDTFETSGNFNIVMTNDTSLEGEIIAKDLTAALKNDANMTLSGKVDTINLIGSNGTQLKLKEFLAQTAVVSVDNDAYCEISVDKEIDVSALSDSIINIYGDAIVNKVSVEEDATVQVKTK